MIYFDCAATSYERPKCVAAAVARAIGTLGAASRGAYGPALQADRTMLAVRERLASLFQAAGPADVVLTQNATQALNTAIFGLGLGKGDRLIVSVADHNSVLRPAYRLEREGVEVRVLGADRDGVLLYDELEKMLLPQEKTAAADGPRPGRTAVVLTHGSNVTGNVTDLERVGALCERAGAVFIVDAAQTAGVIPIDLQKQKIGILCFSGHKALLGPQGTGGLVFGKKIALDPVLLGGSGVQSYRTDMPEELPEHLEAGTQNVHAAAGLLAALAFADGKRADWYRKEERLREYFLDGIDRLNRQAEKNGQPEITVYGSRTAQPHLPTVSFNIGDADAGRVADFLWTRNRIAVRAGAHCAPLMHRHFGTERQGMVRISFSHYNTLAQTGILLRTMETFLQNNC